MQLLTSLAFSHKLVWMLEMKGFSMCKMLLLKGSPTDILNKLLWENCSIQMYLKGQFCH